MRLNGLYRAVFLATAGFGLEFAGDARADDEPAPQAIDVKDRLPYGRQPVDYLGHDTSDAAARLNRKLESAEIELPFREKNGYLRAVLKALEVPVESQLLVFSKTAVNQQLVSPENPRAIYFNDEVTIGWVPGAVSLEVTAVDPLKGPLFYTLKQSAHKPPRFVREARCLACHAGTTTIEVPGLIVRSFLTDASGKPIVGYSRTTHDSPLAKRWGGWYVTGTHGGQTHPGNIFGEQAIEQQRTDPDRKGNVTDLTPYIDVEQYESPHSDVVAHLVLDHQAHGLNLLTRAGYEARLNRRSDVEERLVRYLLFLDEPPLTDEIAGTSGFARWFAAQGPFDSKGRSLRQFDLQTRLFKHRLSYLIYSPLFDSLPSKVKARIYRRLWDVLSASDRSSAERAAIIDIIRATKTDLPEFWRKP